MYFHYNLKFSSTRLMVVIVEYKILGVQKRMAAFKQRLQVLEWQLRPNLS